MLRSGLRRIVSLSAVPARVVVRTVVARVAPELIERRAGALGAEAVALRKEIDQLESQIDDVLAVLERTAKVMADADRSP